MSQSNIHSIEQAKVVWDHTEVFGKGRATLEPLETGFGHTLGNALRRVLLSSIRGSAITEVSIDGAEHEYGTLEGVREDILNILLNLRGLSLSLTEGSEATIRLDAKGAGQVTGKDFELPSNVTLANLDHEVATLADGARLKLEAKVRTGRGYRPADQVSRSDLPMGTIVVDALFNPVRRVSYRVESTRHQERADLDRLVLEIETDGSIGVEEVLGRSAAILRQQLGVLSGSYDGEESASAGADLDPMYFEAVNSEWLGLAPRTAKNLEKEGIQRVGDLVTMAETELLKTPNFGKKTIDEIKEKLAEKGLALGMPLEGWTPSKSPKSKAKSRA